jgi:hypothetical protein
MKYLVLTFLIGLFSICYTFGQIGVGFTYGIDPSSNIRLADSEGVTVNDINPMMAHRYGFHITYKPGLVQLKTGAEFLQRRYLVANNALISNYEYNLRYVHIPLMAGIDLKYLDDDETSFFGMEYGLGFDILTGETVNNIVQDSGFNSFGVSGQAAGYFGYEAIENFRIVLQGMVQYSLTNVVDNDVLGKGKALYFIPKLYVTYYF